MICFNSNIIPRTKGAYLVGGAVRDILSRRIPDDYDFAVQDNPKAFAMAIGEKTGCRVVTLGKPGLVLYRILSPMGVFDVSPMVGTDIIDDLSNRDFTINAMAVDLDSGIVIDPFNGLKDIEEKRIRMVTDQAFVNDPIRMLRAYRFCALFSYNLDKDTEKTIAQQRNSISTSAGERIHVELIKIFETKNAFRSFEQMEQSKLVFNIFHELEDLRPCAQNHHHDFNVWEHTLQTIRHLEDLLNTADEYVLVSEKNTLDPTRRKALLKFAALLHDIGKPLCRFEKNGRIHFHGHESRGADMVETISERLRFSTDEKQYIVTVIRNHLRPLFLYSDFTKGCLTRRAKVAFFMAGGEYTPDTLYHAFADFMAKRRDGNLKEKDRFEEFIRMMLNDFFSQYLPAASGKKLLSGHDLIHEFHLRPSPFFKTILDHVEESRLSGQISTRNQAMDMVKTRLEMGDDQPSS